MLRSFKCLLLDARIVGLQDHPCVPDGIPVWDAPLMDFDKLVRGGFRVRMRMAFYFPINVLKLSWVRISSCKQCRLHSNHQN